MRAYMWDRMKDWLLKGAIETDEKIAMDLAGPGYHIGAIPEAEEIVNRASSGECRERR
jgi:hypothetical protein